VSGLDDIYSYATFGLARALVKDKDGSVREVTPEELRKFEERYAPDLQRSFVVSES
jgi:hypothetical protein